MALINPYAFDAAIPPGAAAEIEHVKIDLEHLDKIYSRLSASHELLLIEGAGGVLAPIGKNFFFADLMKRWSTTVIVVARPGIGTVNHTLLTFRFLASQGIHTAGVILNDLKGKADAASRTNREVLSHYLDVPILSVFPHLEQTETMDRTLLVHVVKKSIDTAALLE